MKPLYLLDECCNERKNIEIEQFAKTFSSVAPF